MVESLLVIVTLGVMAACLLLILIPAVPVSVLQWAIAIIFGALTGFERLPLWAVGMTSLLALLGSTSGLWLPIFGLKGNQISCMGMLAFFIGMIVGSGLIPIPFVGTIIGGVVGVMLVEYVYADTAQAPKGKGKRGARPSRRMSSGARMNHAKRQGRAALKTILLSMIAEFVFASLIVMTVFIAIVQTS
jgi:uncharacterized protein YqgC (DUF456 family)